MDTKNCLVCLTAGHAAETFTCPFCGEASWSESAPSSTTDDADAGSDTSKKSKRGRS